MLIVIIIQLISLVIATISKFLAWGLFTSDVYINKFSPPLGTNSKKSSNEVRRIKGRNNEIAQGFVFYFYSLLAILFFYPNNFFNILFSQITPKIFLFILILWGVIYYFYLGPKLLSRGNGKDINIFTYQGFKSYVLPYIALLPGYYAVALGMFGIMLLAISYNILQDYNSIQSLLNAIQSIDLIKNEDITYANILLVDFGELIASISPKYVLASVFAFLFIFFQQKTNLRYYMLPTTLDFYKTVVWLIFVVTLSFSIIVLPSQYQAQYTVLQNALAQTANSAYTSLNYIKLAEASELHNHLESYDSIWLFGKILRGYGSTATVILAGALLFIQKIILRGASIKVFLEIILPSFASSIIDKLLKQMGVE
jgi:hypothetical protein